MVDLIRQAEVHDFVKAAYRRIDVPHAAGAALYSAEQRAQLPAGALAWSLGLGNPVAYAALRPGDRVLDLGAGGGIDSLLAAQLVGPEGRVTGVDILPEMCDRARLHAREAGATNVEFIEAEMETLPLVNESVDAVISNGAINLSPRKMRVLFEAARVLRDGGLFCITDVVLDEAELPVEVLTHPAAWSGCISGGMAEPVFARSLRRVGLVDQVVHERRDLGIDDCGRYPLFPTELLDVMRRVIPAGRHGRIAISITVSARRGSADAVESVVIASAPARNTDPAPAVLPGMTESPATFDAGARHCGDGVARDLRNWWTSLPAGTQTEVIIGDPSTRQDAPALARMLGHTVEQAHDEGDELHLIVRTKGD